MWSLSLSLCFILVGALGQSAGLSLGEVDDKLSQSEVSSPLHVAQCRAHCLQQILQDKEQTQDCGKEPQCSLCWKKCEELEIVAQWRKSIDAQTPAPDSRPFFKSSKSVATICSSSSCGSGCGVACNFYTSDPTSSPGPVVATKSLPLLTLSPGKVSWTPSPSSDPLVYVLIQQLPHLKWSTVTQTTEHSALLPRTLWDKLEFGLRSVRVLVVSPKGLVAIYYPAQNQAPSSTTSTPPTTTTKITAPPSNPQELERSWSQIMKVDETYPSLDHQAPFTVTQHIVENLEDVWGLRRLSLIHQKSLVIAELAWNEEVKSSPEQEYLITWELDGGGLKGHLVTDSTTVSLSLWPDTLYHIQVELFEPNLAEGEQSSDDVTSFSKSLPLIVDTSEASLPSSPLLTRASALSSEPWSRTWSTLVGILAGIGLVLGVLLLTLALRRACRPNFWSDKQKQLLQDTDDCVEVAVSGEKNKKNGPSPYPTQTRGVSVISLNGSDLLKGPSSYLPRAGVGVVGGGPLPFPLGHHHQGTCSSRPCSCASDASLSWLNNSPSRAPCSATNPVRVHLGFRPN